MEANDYKNIRNIKELQQARLSLSSKIDNKEVEIAGRIADIKAFFTPENIILAAIRESNAKVQWITLALGMIRKLKTCLK